MPFSRREQMMKDMRNSERITKSDAKLIGIGAGVGGGISTGQSMWNKKRHPDYWSARHPYENIGLGVGMGAISPYLPTELIGF